MYTTCIPYLVTDDECLVCFIFISSVKVLYCMNGYLIYSTSPRIEGTRFMQL